MAKTIKKPTTGENKQLIINQIVQSFTDRSRKEIKKYRDALKLAEQPKNPRRDLLQDIYADLKLDAHYFSQYQLRVQNFMSQDFMVIDAAKGDEEPDLTRIFESTWFYAIMEKWITSKFEGTGLIEIETLEEFKLAVYEIPRKHLVPEMKLVAKKAGGNTGVFYNDPQYAYSAIQLGDDDELGILNKLVPLLIWKRNAQQAWAEFSDRFGLPFRTATTSSRNPEDLDTIEDMLDKMGVASWGLFPEGTTVDFKEVRTGDAYNVFDAQILRNNTEISKAINGGSMLSDDGSSYSQSETQFKVFQFISKADCREFRFFCNDVIFPILIEHGFPLEGKSFVWDDTEQLGLKDKWDIVQGLLATHDIPDEDLTKMFGFNVTKKIDKEPNFKPNPNTSSADSKLDIAGTLRASLDYGHSCCGTVENARIDLVSKWLKSFESSLLKVFKGEEKAEIPIDLVTNHVNPLLKGLKEGFEDHLGGVDYNSPDHRKMMVLQASLHRFSSAKTWQDMLALNKLAKEIDNFTDFKKEAMKYGNVVVNHLQAEYQHTRAFAQGAANRLRAQDNKDISDLMYQTAGDSRVRKEHAKYDGIVAPVDDPIWDWLTTPNDYGCRCDIVEIAKGSRTLTETSKVEKDGVAVGFRNNPAKLNDVFKSSHSYFANFPEIKQFNRKKFDLDTVTELLKEDLSKYPKISQSSQEDYEKWWSKEAKRLDLDKDNLVYKNYSGINFTLVKDKLHKKFTHKDYKGQNRQGIAQQVEEILKNPDEVWINANKSNRADYRVNYLKKFNDGWYTVISSTGDEPMNEVITWYKVFENKLGELSSGLPIYLKTKK